MIKSVQSTKKLEKEKYRVPRKVQDIIPAKRIWEDGIFKVGNMFTKTFRFSDINYLIASIWCKESRCVYNNVVHNSDYEQR